MPLSINKVMLAGNLTRCPEVKFLANEQAVCNFGLAINRKYKGRDGEQKEETTFVEVTCWGRTAELCGQYLDKGRNVHVEGRLKLDTWEDKNGGAQRSKLGVVAEQVNFIDWGDKADGGGARGGNKAASGASNANSAPQTPAAADLGSDEPPF